MLVHCMVLTLPSSRRHYYHSIIVAPQTHPPPFSSPFPSPTYHCLRRTFVNSPTSLDNLGQTMPPHPRRIPLEGPGNFRDLGGYIIPSSEHHDRKGHMHNVVMYRHLYRSNSIGSLSKKDLCVIRDSLRVKYAVDLRTTDEFSRDPYDYEGIERVQISIDALNALSSANATASCCEGKNISYDDAHQLLREWAAHVMLDFIPQYRAFFDFLLNTAKGQPFVFHCQAGKDRTGVIAALFLLALGVPEATVVEDYVLTREYITPPDVTGVTEVGPLRFSAEGLRAMYEAPDYFIPIALESVKKKYGSIEQYFTEALGLTEEMRDTLRRSYTRQTSKPCCHV